jgi:protein FRG1
MFQAELTEELEDEEGNVYNRKVSPSCHRTHLRAGTEASFVTDLGGFEATRPALEGRIESTDVTNFIEAVSVVVPQLVSNTQLRVVESQRTREETNLLRVLPSPTSFIMGKLHFKGEAIVKKKRKTKSSHHADALVSHEGDADDSSASISGWIRTPSSSLALGPIYLTLPSTSLTAPLCLAIQPTTGKVYPFLLPDSLVPSSSAALSLEQEDLEAVVETETGSEGPTDVHHVWVCTRVQDTNDRVTFRSATGRFLAADEVGVVSADREARGFQEEWTVGDAEGGSGLSVRSAYGKYLAVDVIAGGKVEVRADGEEEGETERWKVWMQGEYLGKSKAALMERSGIKAMAQGDGLVIRGSLASAEIDNMYVGPTTRYEPTDVVGRRRTFQSRYQGGLVGSAEDVKNLKKARKAGNLSEAMLERRVKLKAYVPSYLMWYRC